MLGHVGPGLGKCAVTDHRVNRRSQPQCQSDSECCGFGRYQHRASVQMHHDETHVLRFAQKLRKSLASLAAARARPGPGRPGVTVAGSLSDIQPALEFSLGSHTFSESDSSLRLSFRAGSSPPGMPPCPATGPGTLSRNRRRPRGLGSF
jgi:hypothetical protein